jgi:hypothetical protein
VEFGKEPLVVFPRNSNKYILSPAMFFFNFILVNRNNVFLNFTPKLEEPSRQWKESVAVM